MTRKIALVLALAAVAGGHAFAHDITVETQPFVPSRTRADVQSELVQYKQSGVNPWSIAYSPVRAFQSTKTRAQVQAEYVDSRNELAAMTREDSGSAYLARRTTRVPAGIASIGE